MKPEKPRLKYGFCKLATYHYFSRNVAEPSCSMFCEMSEQTSVDKWTALVSLSSSPLLKHMY